MMRLVRIAVMMALRPSCTVIEANESVCIDD